MLVHQGLESFKKWFPEQVKGHTDEELLNIMRKGMEGI
jgi:shikimate dehydrogenase